MDALVCTEKRCWVQNSEGSKSKEKTRLARSDAPNSQHSRGHQPKYVEMRMVVEWRSTASARTSRSLQRSDRPEAVG